MKIKMQKSRLRQQKTMRMESMTTSTRLGGCATVLTNSRMVVRADRPNLGSMRAQNFGPVASQNKTLTFAKCASDGAYTARKTI